MLSISLSQKLLLLSAQTEALRVSIGQLLNLLPKLKYIEFLQSVQINFLDRNGEEAAISSSVNEELGIVAGSAEGGFTGYLKVIMSIRLTVSVNILGNKGFQLLNIRTEGCFDLAQLANPATQSDDVAVFIL